MRHYQKISIFVILATFCCPKTALSQVIFDQDYLRNDRDSVQVGLGAYSKRFFRGQDLYNGTSIQPNAAVELKAGPGKIVGRVFSHISADRDSEDPRSKRFQELQTELGYKIKNENGSIEAGGRNFQYTRSTSRLQDTTELYTNLSLETLPIRTELDLNLDVDAFEGLYYQLVLDKTYQVHSEKNNVALTPRVITGGSSGMTKGTNQVYNNDGIAFTTFMVESAIPVDEKISVLPSLGYTASYDDRADSAFVIGIGLNAIPFEY
jgi:hypothetical protein